MNSAGPGGADGFSLRPIGVLRSCFPEKFGIPRQPGLVPEAVAVLELFPEYAQPEAVRGLSGFSHLWILFWFHASRPRSWSATVRPPRLGGNRRVGVFATRSPYRPNPVGLSVVRLLQVETDSGVRLHLAGGDFLDGTPVVDIKPYVAAADAVPEASMGFAEEPWQQPPLPVGYAAAALSPLAAAETRHPGFRALLEAVLRQDPRPGYQRDPERHYGTALYDLNVRWLAREGGIEVVSIASRP